ncbi:MAG: FAD-binding protein [Raoultibacter sp.]
MGESYTSRRSFLKIGATAGLGALGMSMLGGCAPKGAGKSNGSSVSAAEVVWDGAFDVVVVGFGDAGASAAIAAADQGASVLIVDKAPEGHEGGNSRYCAQLFVSITDVEKGLKHYQALRGNYTTSDEVLSVYVQGMHDIRDTLIGWGADASKIKDLTDQKLSNLTVEYPELEGSESVRTNLIDGVLMRAGLWKFLKKNVVSRKEKIDCWYESPGKSLIQDPETQAIVGVQVEHDGKLVNIAAKNGVVMALGGFEANPYYTETFLGYTKMFPIGTLYNEGDGIGMTQSVKAKMWHLSAWESNGVGLAEQADRVRNLSSLDFFRKGSIVLVGGDARRYVAEDLEQRHGHIKVGGTWMIPTRPERNIFIFDAAHIKKDNKPYKNWSNNCIQEIASGKLVEGGSLSDVASKLSLDPGALQATIDMFNASAVSGLDAFGREAVNMIAFGEGPYYALEVWPSILNSQGGPQRTARGEIVDVNDKPIPHLYSAGEFGGVTANMYQGGGNIAECVVFGKISGENAAQPKNDTPEIKSSGLKFTPGCGTQSIYDQSPDKTGLKAGETVGVGEGLGGPIWVKVTSNGADVSNVEVLHATETEGVGTVAIKELPVAMVAARSAKVDAISGATVTSDGLIAAVKNAQNV